MAPKYHPLTTKSTVFLVDGPGINDSNLRNEYANQTSIRYVLKNSKSFKLLVIIDANQINYEGGKTMIELFTSILRKFSHIDTDELESVIIPYFVNFNAVTKTLVDD